MRLMVCGKLLIGDLGVTRMSPELMNRWQADKVRALGLALERGIEKGAERCVVVGGLLADGFVPQSLLKATMDEIGSHPIPVSWFPLEREACDLESRVALPDGLVVERGGTSVSIGGFDVRRTPFDIELDLDTSDGKRTIRIDTLEPSGFENQRESGFLLLDVEDGKAVSVEKVPCALHAFISRTADVGAGKGAEGMLSAIRTAVDDVDESSCLRLVLRGRVAISDYYNVDDLAEVLGKRFFYAEVDDECTVDLDEEELEGDVSLLAEFIRLVLSDETLSPSEQVRVLRCGWNAMNGRRLAE